MRDELDPEDGVELVGHWDGDVKAVCEDEQPPDLLDAGVDAAAVDDGDEVLDLLLVVLGQVYGDLVPTGLQQGPQVRADRSQHQPVRVHAPAVPAPKHGVSVEAGVQAIPGLGDNVLVEVLRVDPQHRHLGPDLQQQLLEIHPESHEKIFLSKNNPSIALMVIIYFKKPNI